MIKRSNGDSDGGVVVGVVCALEEGDDRWVPPVMETKENGQVCREADGWGRVVRERGRRGLVGLACWLVRARGCWAGPVGLARLDCLIFF